MMTEQSNQEGRQKKRIEDWRAAVLSGLIGGLVFMILEMAMVPLFLGGSAWGPPRMIAAIVMGNEVLPPPATFDMGIVMVAMLVHFPLSIIYAIAAAIIFDRVSPLPSVIIGAVLGLLVYVINFYGFTAVFPWFAEARNWVSIFAHIVFGVAVAASYEGLVRPVRVEARDPGAHPEVRA